MELTSLGKPSAVSASVAILSAAARDAAASVDELPSVVVVVARCGSAAGAPPTFRCARSSSGDASTCDSSAKGAHCAVMVAMSPARGERAARDASARAQERLELPGDQRQVLLFYVFLCVEGGRESRSRAMARRACGGR
jgi:hypothetical protein